MSASRWRGVVAALALPVMLLAACGGSDGGSGASGTTATTTGGGSSSDSGAGDAATAGGGGSSDLPDPCSLLSAGELNEATGAAFADGVFNESLSSEQQSVCDWTSEDPFETAQVLITPFGDSIDAQRASVEDAFGEPAVDVDLADDAYRTAEGSLVAMRVGPLFVQVSYIPSGPGEVSDTTVGLASTALGHM